jgi:hypothetical protein
VGEGEEGRGSVSTGQWSYAVSSFPHPDYSTIKYTPGAKTTQTSGQTGKFAKILHYIIAIIL